MWPISNPAATLHSGLARFANVQSNSKNINDTWLEALKVEEAWLADALGELLIEIPRVGNTLAALGRNKAALRARAYEGHWAKPFLSRAGSSDGLVTTDALAVLELAAELIAAAGVTQHQPISEPAREELKELLQAVQDVLLDTPDAELPKELRLPLLDALGRMRAAIATYASSGEDGIREALEVLAFAVSSVPAPIKKQNNRWKKPLVSLLAAGWLCFTQGPDVQDSAAAWGEMLHLPEVVSSIQERVQAPLEIETRPSPHQIAAGHGEPRSELDDVIDAELVDDGEAH